MLLLAKEVDVAGGWIIALRDFERTWKAVLWLDLRSNAWPLTVSDDQMYSTPRIPCHGTLEPTEWPERLGCG